MSNLGKYTRRAFFVAAGGAAAMGLGLLSTRAVCGGLTKPKKLADQLLEILPHEQAKVLGRRLVPQHAGWTDKDRLMAELLGDILPNSLADNDAPGDLAELLKQRCREDFTVCRVVTMDGWVLSRTEAQLCALHALSDVYA